MRKWSLKGSPGSPGGTPGESRISSKSRFGTHGGPRVQKVMKMSSKSHENRSPGRPKKHAENHIEKDMANESKSIPEWSLNIITNQQKI